MELAKKRGHAICNDLFWRFWLSFELPSWVHSTYHTYCAMTLARGRQRKSDESGFILGDLKVADQAAKISQAQENLGSDGEMTRMICQLVSRKVNSVILMFVTCWS